MRLFLILFLLIMATLSALTAGTVAIGVYFFDWSSAAWQDVSVWNARPVLAGGIVALASFLGAGVLTVLWRMIVKLLSGSGKPRPKVRPQSNRRTTT